MGSLRTLKRDMDQMILDQSISLARIAMEEDARKRKSSDTRGREGIKNWAMIIASIVFITFGIGVGGYLYFNYYREQATVEKPADLIKKTKVPIVVESQKELSLSGMSSEKTISEIKNSILESSVTAGSIQKIILTKRTPTDEGGEVQIAIAPRDASTKLQVRLYTYNVLFDYNSTIKHPPYFIVDKRINDFNDDTIHSPGNVLTGLRTFETMGIDYCGIKEYKVLPPDPYVNFVEMSIVDHALQNSQVNYLKKISLRQLKMNLNLY